MQYVYEVRIVVQLNTKIKIIYSIKGINNHLQLIHLAFSVFKFDHITKKTTDITSYFCDGTCL